MSIAAANCASPIGILTADAYLLIENNRKNVYKKFYSSAAEAFLMVRLLLISAWKSFRRARTDRNPTMLVDIH
jgi:hypothetical protein